MHERLAALKWAGAIILALAFCFAPVLASGTVPSPSAKITNATAGSEEGVPTSPELYPRTVVWWPFTTGPHYGDVPRDRMRAETTLRLEIGSFAIGEHLALPVELVNGISFENGQSQYFLAQLKTSALGTPFAETLASQGAQIVATMPVNGLVLRMDSAAYGLVSGSPLLQYLAPYHAAYKLSPNVGHATKLTPEAAASPNFDLLVTLFAGEPGAATAEALTAMGANVRAIYEGQAPIPTELRVTAHASKIPSIAMLESVYQIQEESPTLLASSGSLYLQSQNALVGDYPFWKEGLDGDGELVHVTDSGMSVDAADFAHTLTTSGWSGGATYNVIAEHRKVKSYQSASAVGGGGDLSACDSNVSGQSTHGQVVSGVAAGNATRGQIPFATDGAPSPTDMDISEYWGGDESPQVPVPSYGAGWYKDDDQNDRFSELQDTAYDGIAKGARLVFYDATSGCPEANSINAGSTSQNLTVPWNTHGAFIHNASYGSEPAAGFDPAYSSAGDTTVYANPIHVAVRSAGNAGARDTSGTSADPGNIDNDASCKNCIVVGASSGVGGGVWGFSAEGPASSNRLRVAPFIMSEGYDYGCRSEDGAGEDQTGAATCETAGPLSGTSFSSPNIAGAAAIIHEYFRRGYYPDGAASPDPGDHVTAISSALVKALMITGARPMAAGARGIPDGRFNNVWGYGQLFLTRALPLANFPAETVTGLIVHDLPGDLDNDGTEDGASHLSMNATIGTAPGTEESAEFQVLAADEDLAVSLVWHDNGTTQDVANNLDLEVRYCGGDGTCGNGDDWLYYGNAFSEFPDRDPTSSTDLDGDNLPTGWNYTIPQAMVAAHGGGAPYTDWRDAENNTEAVFIPIESRTPTEPSTSGFNTITPGLWKVSVFRRDGSTAVPFSIAIGGPVAADSTIRLDQNPIVCNGAERIIVSEVDRGEDPSCTEASCSEATISSRTTLRVYDTMGALVDTETNVDFTRPDSASLKFESTDRMPLTRYITPAANNDGMLSIDHGFSIEATYQDTAGGSTVDRISTASVDCQPDLDVSRVSQIGQDLPFILVGGCDDDNYLDQNETFAISVSFFNVDPSDLVQAQLRLQACDNTNGLRDPAVDGCTPVSYITIHDDEQELGYLPAQTLQLSRFSFTVTGTPPARNMVDLDVCLSGAVTGQHQEDCVTFTMLAQADEDKHFYITDCPNGCTANFDVNNDETYEERVSRNPFDPIDFIHQGMDETRTYEALTAAADEDSNGTPDCKQDGTLFGGWTQDYDCGNPFFTGPWNFDSDDEGFTSGISSLSAETSSRLTQWSEDHNWDNFPDPGEDENGNDDIDHNWGTGGGCGWLSNDTGTGPGGIWHTGSIGNWSSTHTTNLCGGANRVNDSICEQYDVYTSTAGQEIWFEMLHTPEVHPVHFGTHPDGYDWRTQIIDWSWGMQWDQDEGALWSWELDIDGKDESAKTGDTIIHGDFFGNNVGLVSGGQWDIFDGGLAFAGSRIEHGSTGGDELLGSIGGNRTGRRGCWFNNLNAIAEGEGTAADRAVNMVLPWDDDCDNEFDLGADGCPGSCGVDDDGNGKIDDTAEICPCKRCDTGPRAGVGCFGTTFCNPNGGRSNLCVLSVNGSGTPSGYGDDICGDGNTDEGVFSRFGTDIVQTTGVGERGTRNGSPELVNGMGRAGRGNGQIEYNTFEDLYGPAGDTWIGEVGFFVSERDGQVWQPSYGVAIDSMVIEWMEIHPDVQTTADVCYTGGGAPSTFEGQCAVVALGETANTFDGDSLISVAVTDPIPDGNLIDCDADGTMEVQLQAWSERERDPEVFCLDPIAPGSTHFEGLIRTSTTVRTPGDGLVYLAFDGVDTPSITASYLDADDGVHARDNGPDGQPGIAGFDDDNDGQVDEADELCPTTSSLGPGRTPHIGGQAARYSDDNCGCLDNPVQDGTLASFDSADLIITQVRVTDDGDNDGWADPGEEVTIHFTARNLADFPLENIRLRLSTASDKVDCLTGDTIDIPLLDAFGDPSDEISSTDASVTGTFSFIAADVTRPGGDTSSDFFSEFIVTMQAIGKATLGSDGGGRRDTLENLDISTIDLPIFGTSVVQSFRVVHNLDATQAGANTTWADDFESYTTDASMFVNWERYNTGDDPAELDGTRCQSNDPGNPFGANTDPLNYCEVGQGFSNSANEWHLNGPAGCESQGVSCWADTLDSIDGDSSSEGQNMLMLSHVGFSNGDFFTDHMSTFWNRMRWIETANNIQLGLDDPELTYWTKMSMTDGRLFVGLDFPVSFDSARTYICVDDNNNNACDTLETGNLTGDENWEPLTAYFNTEQSFRLNNFINCMFDPSDDGNNEDLFYEGETRVGPSSTCFPNLSDTCIGRTREDSVWAPQIGTTFVTLRNGCFPETGEVDSRVPGVYESGAKADNIWALRKYDLGQYQGRKVLIRFHVAPGGIPGNDFCAESSTCGNLDDGWHIDDIKITGARTAAFNVSVDNVGSPSGEICPTGTCTTIQPRVAVRPHFVPSDSRLRPIPLADKKAVACSDTAVAYCDFDEDGTSDATSDVAQSDAPGRKWLLDARASTSDSCFGGDLQYRMELQDGTVLRDWLSDSGPVVAPVYNTTYNVFVRCSSDFSCNGSTTITINTGLVNDECLPLEGMSWSSKTNFGWTAGSAGCPSIYDVSTGGLAALRTNGNFSGATCHENDTSATSSTDASTPGAGTGNWYLSRADGKTWNNGAGLQASDRDASLTACP